MTHTEKNKTGDGQKRAEEMSNCTCQKMRIMSRATSTEALSSSEKNTSANTRNDLSSVSPGEGGVDYLGPVACITFQPTLLKWLLTLGDELRHFTAPDLLPILQIQAALILQNAIFKTTR